MNSNTASKISMTPAAADLLSLEPRLQAGFVLGGRYRVVAHVGTGGMGEVYRVEHVGLGRHFAAKILRRELAVQPRLVARFQTEVRAMARLRSDHVTRIVDSGDLADGTPYLVMELLEGSDLKSLLERVGSLAPLHAIDVAIEACWGLKVVHHAGLVHRDIKPSNLFVTRADSGRARCVLLDFGVAKAEETTQTCGHHLVGTLKYMAPEQLECGVVDARTDLYSLGVVIYRCIAGQPPHSGETIEQVLYSIMNKTPAPLRSYCPEISQELSRLVERAIARNPKDRFTDAQSMARAFLEFGRRTRPHAFASEASTLSTPALRPRGALQHRSRHPRLWLASLASLGLACTCFAVAQRAARSPVRAELATTPNSARELAREGQQRTTTPTAILQSDARLATTSQLPLRHDVTLLGSGAPSIPVSPETKGKHPVPPTARQQPWRKPPGARGEARVADIHSVNPYDE